MHVSLLEEPPVAYNAISYYRGENPPPKQIFLDRTIVDVPESTEAALCSTHRSKENLETPLWIDAICINQANL